MFENYWRNVQALCDRLGLPNPIREEDVRIEGVTFIQETTRTLYVAGTKMNLGGRLFLQEKFSGPGFQVVSADIFPDFKQHAAAHFAELWNDAEEHNRTLLLALALSRSIQIRWKREV